MWSFLHGPDLTLLDGVDRVKDRADADEGEGEDDEPAERFHFRQQNDQDELNSVHQGVKTALKNENQIEWAINKIF